jgi:hypothetical protein
VVFASPEDQVTIANVIAGFRTQGRRAEVLPLTRIDPRYASKAVELVLKNPDRPSAAPGIASEGKFQVEPDTKHNRLLLWATPDELSEVREFLTRLGETFATPQVATQLHVVHLHGAKPHDVSQRLRQAWKELSDAPLVVDTGQGDPSVPSTVTSPSSARPAEAASQPAAPTAPPPSDDKTAEPMSDRSAARPAAQLVVQQKPVADLQADQVEPDPALAKSPTDEGARPSLDPDVATAEPMAPVRVIMGEGGDMVIVSRDPLAAQTAKQFVEQIVPAEGDVQVIQLKHARALLVKTQLDAMLEHTRSGETSALSSDPPLRIESDMRTNRLLIQHATERQSRLINEMIPQLDRPEQEDERLVRQQRIYQAKRKRAAEIAEVIKEVFRDLLSSSDKVFAGRESYQPFGYNRAVAATTKSPEYQGLLSVGVDLEGNTLVLSAPAYLMEEVMKVVVLVDASAGNERVAVVPLKSPAAKENISEALKRVLARPE